MHIRQTGKLVTMALFSIVVFGLVFSPQLALAEISVDSYRQLSIQSMQQEISNFEQLIALANQYKDDPETLAHREKVKNCSSIRPKIHFSLRLVQLPRNMLPTWAKMGERWRHIWMLMEISSSRLMTRLPRSTHSWRSMNH